MADIGIQLLILLDPQNTHIGYDTIINLRIFKRLQNNQECRGHITNQIDKDKHLFLPHFDTELAEGPLPGLSDTFVYIYYDNEESVQSIKKNLVGRAINRLFPVDELPNYLHGAAIELLQKLIKKPPTELNEQERDELIDMAKQHLNELAQLFDQYMIDQLGVDVVEPH
ncbi:hypothetical protein I4U23_011477 [Adineta vaga]|nr:hypothetical protein I4U23_011477 [Adineta vaga]